MVSTKHLQRWLIFAPVTGLPALLSGLLAITIPTLIVLSVDSAATELPLMPYLPFILLAAIFLGWRYGAFVTWASAVVAELWFIGSPARLLESPARILGFTSFIVVAAMLVALVAATRKLAGFNIPRDSASRTRSNIIFSLEDGIAWASWYGTKEPVCLGNEDEVAEMMEDFLAQRELGRRLVASVR